MHTILLPRSFRYCYCCSLAAPFLCTLSLRTACVMCSLRRLTITTGSISHSQTSQTIHQTPDGYHWQQFARRGVEKGASEKKRRMRLDKGLNSYRALCACARIANNYWYWFSGCRFSTHSARDLSVAGNRRCLSSLPLGYDRDQTRQSPAAAASPRSRVR